MFPKVSSIVADSTVAFGHMRLCLITNLYKNKITFSFGAYLGAYDYDDNDDSDVSDFVFVSYY